MPQALVQADGEPTGLRDVQLWIYPEYDDPRLLVMMEGQVEGTGITATVRFLVPVAAEMYSAGSMDAQGKYSGGPPARKASSLTGWDEISYQVTTGTFRMEYYDPIIKGFPDKTISYEFRPLYPITTLTVIIREPRNSSNFSVLPKTDSKINEGGFVAHLYRYDSLSKEQPLKYEIAYTRSETEPSLTESTDASTSVPMIAGIAVGVALLLVFGALWVFRSRPRRRAAPVRSVAAKKTGGKRTEARFCSQCGHRLEGMPRFCPNCGTKLQ